jgi:hypothetical protein
MLGAVSPNWNFFFNRMNRMSMLRNAQNPHVRHAMPPLVLLARTSGVENCVIFEKIQ